MNLIFLDDADFVDGDHARLEDERLAHLHKVLRAKVGDTVVVGRIDGKLGRATITGLDASAVHLEVTLDREPPPPSPIILAVALPRPPTLRKILQQATSMGVKRIVLFHSARVEKSYWDSSGLAPPAIRRQLGLGLEQARDTMRPRVDFHRRFLPFVEDELPTLAPKILVADAAADRPCPAGLDEAAVLVVGPEGGLLDFELGRLRQAGAIGVRLGVRPLRVETAVVAALGRLGAL